MPGNYSIRQKSRVVFVALLAALLVCAESSVSRASGTASIIDLGTLAYPLDIGSAGESVNEFGEVVGGSGGFSGYHTYRTGANKPISPRDDLGTLGGTKSGGDAINSSGQVAGTSWFAGDTAFHAYRTTPGGKIDAASDLGTLAGYNSTGADMNDSGQVVGSLVGLSGVTRAYRTTPGGVITAASDLGSLGGNTTRAYGVNASGQVAGYSMLLGSPWQRAFRTTATGGVTAASDLGTLGGFESAGYDINDSGQVVGESATINDADFHAFRTTATGGITAESDLGTLGGPGTNSRAYSINNLGQVVGVSNLDNGNNAAFFVDVDGKMINLNTLLTPDNGMYLLEARDINDAGQITGIGYHDGRSRAFLLTVPEPGSLGVVVAWLLGARRGRRSPSS